MIYTPQELIEYAYEKGLKDGLVNALMNNDIDFGVFMLDGSIASVDDENALYISLPEFPDADGMTCEEAIEASSKGITVKKAEPEKLIDRLSDEIADKFRKMPDKDIRVAVYGIVDEDHDEDDDIEVCFVFRDHGQTDEELENEIYSVVMEDFIERSDIDTRGKLNRTIKRGLQIWNGSLEIQRLKSTGMM